MNAFSFFSLCEWLLSHMSSPRKMVVSSRPEFARPRGLLWLHRLENLTCGEKSCSEFRQPLWNSCNMRKTGSGRT